jgi:membrane-bound lytic murein transglycosylase D
MIYFQKPYKIVFLLLILLSSIVNGFAKQDDDTTFIGDVNQIKPVFEDNLDSLLNLYYVQQSGAITVDLVNDTTPGDSLVSYVPDSVYAARLAKIPSAIKLTYNRIVRKYVEMYTQRKKDRVEVMLGLTDYYFPIFDDIFDYYGLPNELKYMSIIESALNPRARSRTRAIGVWQFMYGTGKLYGLTINSLVDERRDPIKETHAACRFSKDLYDIFGDWQLVIAAYNCGPRNVQKAIRRSGGKRDFWDIYRYLPRETRGHVPAFIAAVYTMNYYKEHNLVPVKSAFPSKSDTIMVNDDLHLMQVAEVLKIPLDQLRDLNPQYIRDIIPAKGNSYPLTLPIEQTTKFIELEDSILAFKDSVYFNPKELNKAPNYAKYLKNGSVKPRGSYVAIKYIVKSGDNVGVISEWFRCRVNDILDWNDLYSSRIKAGQKLVIYVQKKYAATYENINEMSYNEKQQIRNSNPGTEPVPEKISEKKESSPTKSDNSKIVYYTVKQGDTLWDIAKRFPGISGEDLIKWNGLDENASIIPGQQLKIKIM